MTAPDRSEKKEKKKKETIVIGTDSESEHEHVIENDSPTAMYSPTDTSTEPQTPSELYTMAAEMGGSQDQTSLPASQNMIDSRMTPEELSEVLKMIPSLPAAFRDLLLESKFLTWFSRRMFDITMEGGYYSRYDQSMGWKMRDQEPHLLREFLNYDLRQFYGTPGVNTHKIRIYIFKKYGLSNREAMVVMGRKTTAEALRMAGKNTGQEIPQKKKDKAVPVGLEGPSQQRNVCNEEKSIDGRTQGKRNTRFDPQSTDESKPKRAKHDRYGQRKAKVLEQSYLSAEKGEAPPLKKNQRKKRSNEAKHQTTKESETHTKQKDKASRPGKTEQTSAPITIDIPEGGAGYKKWVDKGCKNKESAWEIINNTLSFRTEAVRLATPTQTQQETHASGMPGSSTDALQNLSQVVHGASTDHSSQEDAPVTQNQSDSESEPQLFLTCPLQDIQNKKTKSKVRSIIHEISSQKNDLSDREKLHLRKMKEQHRFSQKAEYTNPDAKKIYRCGLEGCTSPINPNGIERAVRSHIKKFHQDAHSTYFITINKHDKSQLFVGIGLNKSKTRNNKKAQPKTAAVVRSQQNRDTDIFPDPQPSNEAEAFFQLVISNQRPQSQNEAEAIQNETVPQAPMRQTGQAKKPIGEESVEIILDLMTDDELNNTPENNGAQQHNPSPVADPGPELQANAEESHRALLGFTSSAEIEAMGGRRLPSSSGSEEGDPNRDNDEIPSTQNGKWWISLPISPTPQIK